MFDTQSTKNNEAAALPLVEAQPELVSVSAPALHAASVHRRALGGVLSLVSRELAVKVLAFGGWIVMARFLEPTLFGLLAFASFMVNLFALLSELGLGAGFIRGRLEATPRDLNALFTFQLACVLAVVVPTLIAAPIIGLAFGAGGVAWVAAALALSLLLMSLRTVPIVVLQRELTYGPMIMSDVSGQIAFWAVVIPAALLKVGIWSVVLPTLAFSLASVTVLYARTPWRPSLELGWRSVLGSARFSLLYQGQSAASFAKYSSLTLFGGLVYGGTAVGYLTWAHQVAMLPAQLMQLVSRVSYPALSRLQDDREAFIKLVEASLRWAYRFILPAMAVLAGLAPQIIVYVYGSKWLPVLPVLYLLCANMVLSVTAGLLQSVLYSLGRATAGIRVAMGSALITWLLAPLFLLAGADFQGLAVAYLIGTAATTLAAIVIELRDLGKIDYLGTLWLPALSATAIIAALQALGPIVVHNLISLLAVAAIAASVGLTINLWSDRAVALATARRLLADVLDRPA